MKKYGILTFQNTINYGAELQIYALYNTLNSMGLNIRIIQYYNDNIEKNEFPKLLDNLSMKKLLYYIVRSFTTRNKKKSFRKFEDDYLLYSSNSYCKDNFSSLSEEFDAIIVGSDQIWNTNLTDGDLNYFLPLKNVEKYSYAASFGVGNLLSDFKVITCRELAGKEIVETISPKFASVVLDPTFLLSKEEWEKFGNISNISNIEHEKYILLYFVKDKEILNFSQKYAAENNLKVKYISMRPFSKRGIETINDASPRDFINLISNAEAVIAGSYHGFILSLNLNKPVLVSLELDPKNKNSRMETIFEIFGMDKEKLIINSNNYDKDFFKDYEKINEHIEDWRLKSIDILKEVLDYE